MNAASAPLVMDDLTRTARTLAARAMEDPRFDAVVAMAARGAANLVSRYAKNPAEARNVSYEVQVPISEVRMPELRQRMDTVIGYADLAIHYGAGPRSSLMFICRPKLRVGEAMRTLRLLSGRANEIGEMPGVSLPHREQWFVLTEDERGHDMFKTSPFAVVHLVGGVFFGDDKGKWPAE